MAVDPPVRRAARSRYAAAARVPALLVLALALSACPAPVTVQDLESSLALSRSGDNAAAEAAVRALLERKGDFALNEEGRLLLRSRLVPLIENQGRLGEAMSLANQVYADWLARRGERSPNTISALGNLGRLYTSVGRPAQAVTLQERHVMLTIEVLGAWHESAIAARTNLASTYVRLGRLPQAVRMLEAALDVSRRIRPGGSLQTQLAATTLARTYLAAGRPDDAQAVNAAALAQLVRDHGTDSPYSLVARSNEVAILMARDQGPAALAAQQSLLNTAAVTWGESHPFTLEQLSRLSVLHDKLDAREAALAHAPRYIRSAEALRAQPGLAREERRSVFANLAESYRFYSRLYGLWGRYDEGFRVAELSKARTLLESMTEQRASRFAPLPAEDQQALSRLEQRLVELEQGIGEAVAPPQRTRRVQMRDAALREHVQLVDRLKATHPKFAQLSEPRVLSGDQLPGLIPPGAMYISFLVGESDLGAWLVDERGQLRYVDLGPARGIASAVEVLRRGSAYEGGIRELDDTEGLKAWRQQDGVFVLRDARAVPAAGDMPVRDTATVAAYLGQRLLAPLASVVGSRNRWIVAPEGALAQLPFELLVVNGRRVLEAVELHYTQSLSVYALAQARQQAYSQAQQRPKDLLAFGNPAYEGSTEPNQARRARLRNTITASSDQLAETRDLWPPLPGTEREVIALRALFPRSDMHLRTDASEATLQRLNREGLLRGYRYLHFAAHGNLSPLDPALSSVVLSQVQLAVGTDGHVTAAEWPGYDLRSDLTVLSACETGLGTQQSGEGVMGLPFALFVAGNVNTVLSLWSVYDDITPVFMHRFFTRLRAGETPSRALTQTKREMASDPKTRQPANWAAFVLVGSG